MRRLATLLAIALALGACASAAPPVDAPVGRSGPASIEPSSPLGTPTSPLTTPTPRPVPTGIPYASPGPAPFFDGLVTGADSPFQLTGLAGHPTFVFFGYTHCPDICPATIGELVLVLQGDPDARVVFATIDPERDTPAFLAEWGKSLPAQFTPVTGTPLAVRAVADAWGVRYARVESTSAAGYSMSHTADVYLVDASGRLIQRYPFGTPAQVMLDDLRGLPAS